MIGCMFFNHTHTKLSRSRNFPGFQPHPSLRHGLRKSSQPCLFDDASGHKFSSYKRAKCSATGKASGIQLNVCLQVNFCVMHLLSNSRGILRGVCPEGESQGEQESPPQM